MIFNEIYSAYYNAVAKILCHIKDCNTDEKALGKIVCDNAFGESMLTVLPSLKDGKWQLILPDMTTRIEHRPTMPLTITQKKWLKAISLDPRIKLFEIDFSVLDGIEPLFTPDDYVIFDKYSDGDPYDDPEYIKHFRTVLEALKTNQNLKLEMISRTTGKTVYVRCTPERLEYSEKDDKFRLIVSGSGAIKTVNLSRITKCKIYTSDITLAPTENKTEYKTVTLKVSEKRNTLERCMLHFAHFEKRAEKIDDHYLLHITFNAEDTSEMVIRVLSFGPLVEVLESEDFKNLIIAKLKEQKNCGLI